MKNKINHQNDVICFSLGIGDTQVGHYILKAKYVPCKITTTDFRCFFDLKEYTTFFHCPAAVMECVVNA